MTSASIRKVACRLVTVFPSNRCNAGFSSRATSVRALAGRERRPGGALGLRARSRHLTMRSVRGSTVKLVVVAWGCIAASVALNGCSRAPWRDPASASATPQPPFVLPAMAAAEKAQYAKYTGDPAAMPPFPPWSKGLIGADLTSRFPKRATCTGNTDSVVVRYDGNPSGLKLLGWGWDPAAKQRIDHVILVGPSARIVGAGDGGVARPDIPAAMPLIRDPDTGWYAELPLPATAVDAYGIVDGGAAICRLGHLSVG